MNSRTNLSSGFSTVSLVIVLGVAAIIGISLFFMTRQTPQSAPAAVTGNTAEQQRVVPSETLTNRELNTTIPDIVGRGQSLECTWRMPVEGENPFNKGTLWTNGVKGRSSITATIGGMAAEANAIYTNNTVYTWTIIGGQKFGMKFNESSLADANRSMTAQERQQAEQVRQNMVFNCKPWAPDETKFTLPADITFTEK